MARKKSENRVPGGRSKNTNGEELRKGKGSFVEIKKQQVKTNHRQKYSGAPPIEKCTMLKWKRVQQVIELLMLLFY